MISTKKVECPLEIRVNKICFVPECIVYISLINFYYSLVNISVNALKTLYSTYNYRWLITFAVLPVERFIYHTAITVILNQYCKSLCRVEPKRSICDGPINAWKKTHNYWCRLPIHWNWMYLESFINIHSIAILKKWCHQLIILIDEYFAKMKSFNGNIQCRNKYPLGMPLYI